MHDGTIPIKYADAGQEVDALQKVAAEVAKILTPNEEIYYIALQNPTAISPRKDCIVATSNRALLYHPDVFGRVKFADFQWQDVRNVHLKQGVLSSEITVEATDGRQESLGNLSKDQAKRFYAVSQQMEHEWREKRRIREMEEARAQSGGVYVGAAEQTPVPSEDPVAKLARAKAMLDQGLISEAEYESVKAKILASM